MAENSDSFTGSDQPLLVNTEDLRRDRRRLTFLLPSGRRESVVVDMADDSNELRQRIADSLLAERRGVIRGGTLTERAS